MRRLYSALRPLARRLPEGIKAPIRRWLTRASNKNQYTARLAQEHAIFADQEEINDLPPIFHYWSNKYLRPKLEEFGFSNPDQFFAHFLAKAYGDADRKGVRFASLGSGNCDTEVRVAKLLVERGIHDFTIDCIDINKVMLERGTTLAGTQGVGPNIEPVIGDFNNWLPQHRYDAIVANQSLHHVLELERLFDVIEQNLPENGRFITSDIIGRNGHLRWPEALEIVQEYWRELPKTYRYNVQLRRKESRFKDWDCSVAGFEGIRAQDVLPLLVERFDFEFFLGFANIVDPFIDRAFGSHFDVNSESDRRFIDRVHARDESEIAAGRVKPTHMMGVFRRKPYLGPVQFWGDLTPRKAIRQTAATDGE